MQMCESYGALFCFGKEQNHGRRTDSVVPMQKKAWAFCGCEIWIKFLMHVIMHGSKNQLILKPYLLDLALFSTQNSSINRCMHVG